MRLFGRRCDSVAQQQQPSQ